jgi:hypothetical protein
MKVVTLQDIIVEHNGINIIQAGTSIVIDEGIKDIFLNIKSKLVKMIGDKSSNKIDGIVKSYVRSLTPEQVQDFKRQVGIDHIGRTDNDDSYTTIVRGPIGYLQGIQQSISEAGFESNLQKSYDYDIDDLVQYNRDNPDKQLEDTEKPFGKLHIFRITQADYDRAAQKAKTMASGQETAPVSEPSVPSLNKTRRTTDASNHDDLEVELNTDIETNETEELKDADFEKEWASVK